MTLAKAFSGAGLVPCRDQPRWKEVCASEGTTEQALLQRGRTHWHCSEVQQRAGQKKPLNAARLKLSLEGAATQHAQCRSADTENSDEA